MKASRDENANGGLTVSGTPQKMVGEVSVPKDPTRRSCQYRTCGGKYDRGRSLGQERRMRSR